MAFRPPASARTRPIGRLALKEDWRPPDRSQRTRRSTGVIGFRNATLVDSRGRIVAYADRLAIGASAIGMSSATFAPSMLPRLLRGRMPPVTVLEAGRPRLRLNGLQVVLPS